MTGMMDCIKSAFFIVAQMTSERRKLFSFCKEESDWFSVELDKSVGLGEFCVIDDSLLFGELIRGIFSFFISEGKVPFGIKLHSRFSHVFAFPEYCFHFFFSKVDVIFEKEQFGNVYADGAHVIVSIFVL